MTILLIASHLSVAAGSIYLYRRYNGVIEGWWARLGALKNEIL